MIGLLSVVLWTGILSYQFILLERIILISAMNNSYEEMCVIRYAFILVIVCFRFFFILLIDFFHSLNYSFPNKIDLKWKNGGDSFLNFGVLYQDNWLYFKYQ